ncbi:hypothetical protein, partial [Acinetobacter baumannii]|uniref:hypothetical protein n=1 Tax=Acinetobacter baumannii TaxID=470 RepID=UPI0022786ACE
MHYRNQNTYTVHLNLLLLDFRWTGKELLPNTTLSVGVALDAMDEDRKGFENFNLVNGQPS